MTAEERLRAAGYQPATAVRMVTLPSDLGDDELFCWRAPNGQVFTERQALQQLDAEKKKHG
ncbi:MAG: hypothetical protein WB462_07620 [Solirubrobacterales bacterium]